jgi:hypothetical protein
LFRSPLSPKNKLLTARRRSEPLEPLLPLPRFLQCLPATYLLPSALFHLPYFATILDAAALLGFFALIASLLASTHSAKVLRTLLRSRYVKTHQEGVYHFFALSVMPSGVWSSCYSCSSRDAKPQPPQ